MVHQLEKFFEDDIHAALLVLGGVAMSFHFKLLHNSGGVPPTLAIGDPVSGKSKAVEAAMAIFDEQDSIGCKLYTI